MSNYEERLARKLYNMHSRVIALESENARLRSQLSALREALNNARSFHGEQCRIFQHRPLGCDCGADDHNARIDAALASTEPGGEEETT